MSQLPTIHGSDLRTLAQAMLGGYANSIQDDVMFQFLNEGKNEIWMVLKELKQDYFAAFTQNTDPTMGNYFAPLNPNTRDYVDALPPDFHEMRFIEVTDLGYEDMRFSYRSISHPDFMEQRRAATNTPSQGISSTSIAMFYYDIIGKRTFMMASYPPIALHLTLWYIRIIPDFGENDALDEILYPYSQKLALFATKRATLANQDEQLFAAWKDEWKESIGRIATSASPRQTADPVFVQDFLGNTIEN